MASLFDNVFKPIFSEIGKTEPPQLRAKFEVSLKSQRGLLMEFPTQSEAKERAKAEGSLYQVVMYVKGVRLIIFEKQY